MFKLKRYKIALTGILMALAGHGFAQVKKNTPVTDLVILTQLKSAIEATPDSLSVHKAYIEAMGIENPELEKQYEVWIKKYPKSAVVPFALAKAYLDQESPKAKPLLLKVIAINPKYTEAWGGLSLDAGRSGDAVLSRDYLAKATASDPSNPDYAFYYASSFSLVDQEKYKTLLLAMIKRFPAHERGAQALYGLAANSETIEEKIKYFQLLHDSFSPAKFNWSSSGMNDFLSILMDTDPAKAIILAREMTTIKGNEKEWGELLIKAEYIAKAKELMNQGKAADALEQLSKVKISKYSSFYKSLILLKAQTADLSGNPKAAYDSLMIELVKTPAPKFQKALIGYGAKLNKNASVVNMEIFMALDAIAKEATPFTLKQYLASGSASLSDYKGKVVLLTYWFPGCAPCRAEFPHFENVVKKFRKEDLQYVGINILSNQNDYVVPFVKSSGYSFSPLEEVKNRVKGNLDNRGAAPVNFLIDQNGKVVFSRFRTDKDSEDELELMINLLLAKSKV